MGAPTKGGGASSGHSRATAGKSEMILGVILTCVDYILLPMGLLRWQHILSTGHLSGALPPWYCFYGCFALIRSVSTSIDAYKIELNAL